MKTKIKKALRRIRARAREIVQVTRGKKRLGISICGRWYVYFSKAKMALKDPPHRKDPYMSQNVRRRLRRQAAARAKGKCECCGRILSPVEASIHHILPRQTHPQFAGDLKNIMFLCTDCHSYLHAVIPALGAGTEPKTESV